MWGIRDHNSHARGEAPAAGMRPRKNPSGVPEPDGAADHALRPGRFETVYLPLVASLATEKPELERFCSPNSRSTQRGIIPRMYVARQDGRLLERSPIVPPVDSELDCEYEMMLLLRDLRPRPGGTSGCARDRRRQQLDNDF